MTFAFLTRLPAIPFRLGPGGGIHLPALATLVATADFLFYGSQRGGPVFATFFVVLATAALFVNPLRADRRRRVVAGLGALAALAAVLADGEALSIFVGWAGCMAAIVTIAAPSLSWDAVLTRVAGLPFVGWWRLPRDLLVVRRAGGRRARAGFDPRDWIFPITLALVFGVLFVSANPVLELWLKRLDPRDLLGGIDRVRPLFWVVAAVLVWPVLRLGRTARPARARPVGAAAVAFGLGLGTAARTLLVCNLVFALQTATDLGCLWAGVGLPAGMTHAEYAHRGAYPLIAAALVAAGLVLATLRGGEAEKVPALRLSLVAFVGQGLMLVVSSILRLDLYVNAYSMTLWRLAALVWMGLVAFGFATILVRILARRSNRWLKTVNATAAALVLWGWCFVDEVDLVARYNLAHCVEVTGSGSKLDLDHLLSLGPAVIPALDARRDALADLVVAVMQRDPATGRIDGVTLAQWRDAAARNRQTRDRSWRTWSFKGWRLDRYLATMPTTARSTASDR